MYWHTHNFYQWHSFGNFKICSIRAQHNQLAVCVCRYRWMVFDSSFSHTLSILMITFLLWQNCQRTHHKLWYFCRCFRIISTCSSNLSIEWNKYAQARTHTHACTHTLGKLLNSHEMTVLFAISQYSFFLMLNGFFWKFTVYEMICRLNFIWSALPFISFEESKKQNKRRIIFSFFSPL